MLGCMHNDDTLCTRRISSDSPEKIVFVYDHEGSFLAQATRMRNLLVESAARPEFVQFGPQSVLRSRLEMCLCRLFCQDAETWGKLWI
jgi:hypothetical protein